MNYPVNEIVVLDIADNRALVVCNNLSSEMNLRDLGFVRDEAHLVRAISDDIDRMALAASLVRLDALFSHGPGWSPAELLDFYRDQGAITGPYRIIAWRRPGDYFVTTRGI